jgi:hypothetical protein
MQLFTNKFVCVTLMRQNPLIAGGGSHITTLRALRMGSSEAFAQFRNRFLLLAHESHLRPEDYRDKLWNKITLALGTAFAAVEA